MANKTFIKILCPDKVSLHLKLRHYWKSVQQLRRIKGLI